MIDSFYKEHIFNLIKFYDGVEIYKQDPINHTALRRLVDDSKTKYTPKKLENYDSIRLERLAYDGKYRIILSPEKRYQIYGGIPQDTPGIYIYLYMYTL